MKNLFGAGATAFLTCLDMAVKSEVEKWPDEEEKPFADSKKIVLRKVHNKGMCMSLLKEYPQFVKYTSLVMAAILTVWDILCLRKKGSYLKKAGLSLGVAGAYTSLPARISPKVRGIRSAAEKKQKIPHHTALSCWA